LLRWRERAFSPPDSKATKTCTNPVGDTPLHMGDPFVRQQGGRYYLFGTTSSNEGFKCWESTDLVNWTLMGWVSVRMPS